MDEISGEEIEDKDGVEKQSHNRLVYLNKKMEAITIVKNETNNHRLLQIDLDVLAGSEEDIEDIYDIIVIELRKGEETTPWEQMKQEFLQEK